MQFNSHPGRINPFGPNAQVLESESSNLNSTGFSDGRTIKPYHHLLGRGDVLAWEIVESSGTKDDLSVFAEGFD